MKIYIGYDHRGREKAHKLVEFLVENGYDVNLPFEDDGGKIDYPDVVIKVAEMVNKNKNNRGILFCGTGIGVNMGANKRAKIRSVLAQTEADAYFARRHEDANVLTFPAGYKDEKFEVKSPRNIEKITQTFLTTEFEAGRHIKRVKKLDSLVEEEIIII